MTMGDRITDRGDVAPGIGTRYRGDTDTFDVFRNGEQIGTVDSTRDRTGRAYGIPTGHDPVRFPDASAALAYVAAVADMPRVDRLDFRRSVMVVHDGWRRRDRVCRYTGTCVTCGVRTFEFDDGENDPRGMLGDRAGSAFHASDYDESGPDVPQCFDCQNDEHRYTRGLAIAQRRWARHARNVNA